MELLWITKNYYELVLITRNYYELLGVNQSWKESLRINVNLSNPVEFIKNWLNFVKHHAENQQKWMEMIGNQSNLMIKTLEIVWNI